MRLEARGARAARRRSRHVRTLVREGGATSDASRPAPSGSSRTCGRSATATRSCARRSSRAGPGEAIVYEVTAGAERAVGAACELRGADAGAARGAAHAAGAAARGRRRSRRTRATLVARLEALGHYEARVETERAGGRRRARRRRSWRPPGPRASGRRLRPRGPAAAGRRRGAAAPRSWPCARGCRTGSPTSPAAATRCSPPGAAPATSTRGSGRRWRFSEARDEARVRLVVEPGERTLVEHVVLAGLGRTRTTDGRARDGAAPRRAVLVRARAREPAAALRARHLRARLDRRARPGARAAARRRGERAGGPAPRPSPGASATRSRTGCAAASR